MLTVGQWMHSKSNTRSWNSYVQRQVGGALARGSLWSLFAVVGLAILREGAETAIFYIGMAPAIETSQLLIGMGAALLFWWCWLLRLFSSVYDCLYDGFS